MEKWKPIKGYEDSYQVSDHGRVKRTEAFVRSKNNSKRTVRERILKQNKTGGGYLGVNLSKNSKVKTKQVHQLMAVSFLGHTPNGHNDVVDHIDNDKFNNEIDNLQVISHRENSSKDTKGSSKYVGVSWCKRSCKWLSSININGKSICIGYFSNELEASNAYQKELLTIINK